MGFSTASDVNIPDPHNSSHTLLLADETFTGDWVDVSGYTSITTAVSSPQTSAQSGWIIDWSDDGITVHESQPFFYGGPGSQGGFSIHSTVRMQYYRIRYINGNLDQTSFHLNTLLRRGTPSGTIKGLGTVSTVDQDSETVAAVLQMRPLTNPLSLVIPFATGDPFVIVTYPPHRSTHITNAVSATTFFSPQLDFFGIFANTRRFFTVFNDTIRGNLFIDFNSGVTTTSYSYKVPPQATWRMPESWINQSGGIWGRWDVGDGTARVMEGF